VQIRRLICEISVANVKDCYYATRTRFSLNKDAPMSRAAETAGRIICHTILGGLHHQYARI
jgi:hypothetical protein